MINLLCEHLWILAIFTGFAWTGLIIGGLLIWDIAIRNRGREHINEDQEDH